MEDQLIYIHVIEKLTNGVPFGLFEEGKKCFFKDGEQIHYNDLWAAIKMIPELEETAHGKSLNQLFPQSFEGSFSHKFSKHDWKKRNSRIY